jgi:uncharacterized membrane protein YbhN (UPF0104 family)
MSHPAREGTTSASTWPGSATLKALARLLVAAVLLIYLVWRGDLAWQPLRAALARWQLALPALLVLSGTLAGQLFRWQSLLRASGLQLPTRDVFAYMMVGKFFNMALPGYIGGDMVRGLYVFRAAAGQENSAGIGAGAVVPSILGDRIAGLVALFALSMAGTAGGVLYGLPQRLIRLGMTVSVLGLVVGVGLYLLAYRFSTPPAFLLRICRRVRLERLLVDLSAAMHLYARNGRLIGTVLLLSLSTQSVIVLSFVLLGEALALQVPIAGYFVLVPLGLMITAVPVAPAGLGVGQMAFLGLFQIVGTAQGANLFTLYMASQAVLNMTGMLLYPFVRITAQRSPRLARVQRP